MSDLNSTRGFRGMLPQENLLLSKCNFLALWAHFKPFRHINNSTSVEKHNSVQKSFLFIYADKPELN